MTIQKLSKVDEKGSILVREEDSATIRYVSVNNTCWYALKDVMAFLYLKEGINEVSSQIWGEYQAKFSFTTKPMVLVDLNGIDEILDVFGRGGAGWRQIEVDFLVELVASELGTIQEVTQMNRQSKIVTQEDMLALEVLNADNAEDRLFALAAYKDFITQ
ncbi:hypothetical protein [Bacillus rhizoplanae]|uniref:hypothetical protein n=1 Tax=Bacillus rhizoplanae TaxID=2880966 RepID=UPI003D1E0346